MNNVTTQMQNRDFIFAATTILSRQLLAFLRLLTTPCLVPIAAVTSKAGKARTEWHRCKLCNSRRSSIWPPGQLID